MNQNDFVCRLKNEESINPDEDIYEGIWSQYEKVIVESLISSFGLDFIVKDQHGGDVDTIHNVRQIGDDPEMTYKSTKNVEAYAQHGKYDTKLYHSDEAFAEIKRRARAEFDEKGTKIVDAYVDGNLLIPRNNKTIERKHQGQLDHVISASEIHEDRGRVLAGVDGVELANHESNLRFTNAALNRNKSNMTVEEYIAWAEKNPDKVNWNGNKGEPLPEDVKNKMRAEYARAKKRYDAELARKYYTSPQFLKDTTLAAGKVGVQMGIRQAMGFALSEVWFATKEELKKLQGECEFAAIIDAIIRGIQNGFERAAEKYKELIGKFIEGAVAGALSSISTTICNIFITTKKNMVKYIRQMYASVVQAGKVLFINPNNLVFGERLREVTIILATGASVIVGSVVGDTLAKTPIGQAPYVGSALVTFTSTLVSGLLSCSFLIFMDRSIFMRRLVDELNKVASTANNYKQIADYMESLAANLAKIDIDAFKAETEKYQKTAMSIAECDDENALSEILKNAYSEFGIRIPWEGDFDSFMGNKSNCLMFE